MPLWEWILAASIAIPVTAVVVATTFRLRRRRPGGAVVSDPDPASAG